MIIEIMMIAVMMMMIINIMMMIIIINQVSFEKSVSFSDDPPQPPASILNRKVKQLIRMYFSSCHKEETDNAFDGRILAEAGRQGEAV